MFRIKVIAKSIIHSKIFNPSPQKDPTDSELKQLQRNYEKIFETIYQTLDLPNFI